MPRTINWREHQEYLKTLNEARKSSRPGGVILFNEDAPRKSSEAHVDLDYWWTRLKQEVRATSWGHGVRLTSYIDKYKTGTRWFRVVGLSVDRKYSGASFAKFMYKDIKEYFEYTGYTFDTQFEPMEPPTPTPTPGPEREVEKEDDGWVTLPEGQSCFGECPEGLENVRVETKLNNGRRGLTLGKGWRWCNGGNNIVAYRVVDEKVDRDLVQEYKQGFRVETPTVDEYRGLCGQTQKEARETVSSGQTWDKNTNLSEQRFKEQFECDFKAENPTLKEPKVKAYIAPKEDPRVDRVTQAVERIMAFSENLDELRDKGVPISRDPHPLRIDEINRILNSDPYRLKTSSIFDQPKEPSFMDTMEQEKREWLSGVNLGGMCD